MTQHGSSHSDAELAAFDWEDPFLLEAQLTSDERMLRDGARAFAQDKLQPRIIRAYARGSHRSRDLPRDGRGRASRRHHSRGVRRARCELRDLRPRRPRDRARRLRLPFDDVRAELARDVSDLCLWLRGAAQDLPAEARDGTPHRLLRPDGAGCRLRPGGHEDPRGEGSLGLSAHRHQDVDLELADRRRVHRLGEIRRPWRRRSAASCSKRA